MAPLLLCSARLVATGAGVDAVQLPRSSDKLSLLSSHSVQRGTAPRPASRQPNS